MHFSSPLRYPGGKGKISPFIKLLIKRNHIGGGCYVEPYAGGASVALSLLFSEYVNDIHINDVDRSVYSFWHSVLYQTEELCRLILDTPVTIEQWHIQRDVQKRKESASLLDLGFSTFFQNRTNRSGIIKAGVIGGKNQDGKWKLDARYNSKELIDRIQRIAQYETRINLYSLDAIEFINHIRPQLPVNTLIYFDPPYYVKGKDLYENHYLHQDHITVSELVKSIRDQYWIVSYDHHSSISEIYQDFRSSIYQLNYSAASSSQGEEIIIFSDNLEVPIMFESLKRTAQLAMFE